MKVKGVFCPQCMSGDVSSLCADGPEWVSDECIVSEEAYACKACGDEFGIRPSYTMDGFCFLGEDDDDIDYDIERD